MTKTMTNWEELARALFEEAGDALFLFDPETEQLQDVNPVTQRLSGFTRRELRAMKISYLIRSDVPGGLQRLRQAFRRTGVFHSQEGFWLRTREEEVWLPVNLTATRLHFEPQTRGLITARDIRERREAHAHLKQMEGELRRVMSSVSDCLWSAEISEKGQWSYRYFSPVIEKITGRLPDYYLPGFERWLGTIHSDDVARVQHLATQHQQGQSSAEEYRVLHADGTLRWVRDSVQVTRAVDGQPNLVDGVLTDITEHKRADEALRESEARRRLLLEQMPALVWTTDAELRSTSSAGAALAGLGEKPDQNVGRTLPEIFRSFGIDDPEYLPLAAHRKALQGESVDYEVNYRGRYFHSHVEPLRDSAGRLIGTVGVGIDVTEKRQAEEALRASEARRRLLIEQMPAIVWTTDTESRFTSCVGAGLAGLGLQPNQYVGMKVEDFLKLSGVDVHNFRPLTAHKNALAGKSVNVEAELLGRYLNGHIEPLSDAEGKIIGTVGVALDVTEKKKAEAALRASEARRRLLIEQMPAIVWTTDTELRATFAAGALTGIGGQPSPWVGRNLAEFFQSQDIHNPHFAPLAASRRALAGESVNYEIEWAGQAFLSHVEPLHDEEGQIIGTVGVALDISAKKKAEEALRTSEAKHRSLIENLTQCVFLKDRACRYTAVNQPFCHSLGRAEADILGKTDYDFFALPLAEKFKADDQLVLEQGKRLELEYDTLLAGKLRTVQMVKSPVRNDRGQVEGVLGIFWDVTEHRQLELQLRQAQKMDAIGQLASGIAHDFNNLLQAILGNLEMVQASLPADHVGQELLNNSIEAGFRAAELTRQLLSFARQTPLRPEALMLNQSIEGTVRLLRRTIDPRIAVQVNLAADVWPVQADAAQINQVLMNLCLNARDAMPAGGTLTLETVNVSISSLDLPEHPEGRPGEFVRLRVHDSGMGMSGEVRAHLFEPFFTTKEIGKGTGLGLAMVFGIVQQHEGWIECQTGVGEGTCFHVYLPRRLAPVPIASPTLPDTSLQGTETILLADDQEMIRRLVSDVLKRYGYQVLVVEDGAQAIALFTEHCTEIDLTLLDLSMPDLSGVDTLRELRHCDPDACVLIASGQITDQTRQEIEEAGAAGFIVKPFRVHELVRGIRAALDRRRRPAT